MLARRARRRCPAHHSRSPAAALESDHDRHEAAHDDVPAASGPGVRFAPREHLRMKAERPAEDTATPDTIKAKWPKDKLVAQMKTSFAFCENALAQLDDAKLGDQIAQTLGNGQTRTVTRAGPVMGHIIDMADHYSQLSNYMRLNNILPPTALPRPRPPGDD